MEETFSKLIDHSLNWNTAFQKGYCWEIDVILDKDGKVIVPNNLMVLLKNEKYKLGEPWAGKSEDVMCGLYKPREQIKLT